MLRQVTRASPDDQFSGVHLLVSQPQGLRPLALSLLQLSVLHQPVSRCQGLRLLALSLLPLSVLHQPAAYGILCLPNDARRVLYTKAFCPSSDHDPNPSNGYGIHHSVSGGIPGGKLRI